MTSLKKTPLNSTKKAIYQVQVYYSEKLKLKILLFTCSLCLVLVYIVL